MVFRLPKAKPPASGILNVKHAPTVKNVQRAGRDGAAAVGDHVDQGIDIIHRDIICPVRGYALFLHFGHHLVKRGHIFAFQLEHGIGDVFANRNFLLVPAKQRHIKGSGGFCISRTVIGPGKRAVRVFCHFVHTTLSIDDRC